MVAKIVDRQTLRRSYFLLSAALLVLIVFVVIFVVLGGRIKDGERRQNELDGTLFQLHEIKSDLQDAETGQRGYLLSGKESYLEPYLYAIGDIDHRLEMINDAMQIDPDRKKWYAMTLDAKLRKFAEMAQTVQMVKDGNTPGAVALLRTDEGLREMESLRATVGSLQRSIRAERTFLNGQTKWLVNQESWVMLGMCTMLIITISLATTLLVRMVRRIDGLATRLEKEATHDSLTGLPNRRLLIQWLDKTIDQANRQKSRVGLLFIDLDGFKGVNDKLGHDSGDLLLKTVAARFSSVIRGADLLARIGGDEFVVLAADENLTQDSLGILAQRLIETFTVPLPEHLLGQKVGASIGIAVYPDSAGTIENLIMSADEAMYRAKKEGKGQFRFA